MKIFGDYYVERKRNGQLWSNINSTKTWMMVDDISLETRELYDSLFKYYVKNDEDLTKEIVHKILKTDPFYYGDINDVNNEITEEKIRLRDSLIEGIQKLKDFFNEFDFDPNFRFIDTMIRSDDAKEYCVNYFRLSGNISVASLVESKVNSPEFKSIIKTLSQGPLKSQINNRLAIYYGPQGSGKTTKAVKETEGRCFVCHSSVLPSDIMEDFKFVDGKATFDKSVVWNAMEDGKEITLDEINLLPYETLRFLQTILDGKEEFTYKNKEVKIKEGFRIIGTMNLFVNGSIFGLPEPLVDRCDTIKEFKTTAEDIAKVMFDFS